MAESGDALAVERKGVAEGCGRLLEEVVYVYTLGVEVWTQPAETVPPPCEELGLEAPVAPDA